MTQAFSPSVARKQREQQDSTRMAYRRAIEERSELRRLCQELGDDPERLTGFYLNPQLGAQR
ncbi:hypothetical protein SAMN05216296_3269 [Pseudomonas pohangensis]|jgi:hypothetical protein|uniref:Transcriptional regulator n=1 Tax=Pseudomonas pohangensis TaxID=364197 RepID=A0A1H2HU96_9PSED|nr:hypothetical protein [Pseudomonas pohangensis]SDU35442.1 hypothetical protein SAMN05216296_3269 [Pseudomonas pohangensis]